MDDSRWARANRHYQEASKWYQEVEARWSVDADDFERWSYHPQPLNTIEWTHCAVSLADDAHKSMVAVRKLKEELLALVKQQDVLWMAEWNEDRDIKWDELEREIHRIKQHLLYKYDYKVETGSNRKEAEDDFEKD